jgi:hypothetical protein
LSLLKCCSHVMADGQTGCHFGVEQPIFFTISNLWYWSLLLFFYFVITLTYSLASTIPPGYTFLLHPLIFWSLLCNLTFTLPPACSTNILASTLRPCPVHITISWLVCYPHCPFTTHLIHIYAHNPPVVQSKCLCVVTDTLVC